VSQIVRVTDRDGVESKIEWHDDETLMEALRDNDLPVLASCGGVRSCATCHVFVEKDRYSQTGSQSEEEIELLTEAESYRSGESRLSCQILFAPRLGGIAVTLAPEE
jgi:2Fe-2S ferredoxin